MSKKSSIFFFLALVAEIIAGELNFSLGVYFFKPLLMLTLLYEVSKTATRYKRNFIAALFFSLLGDIFLMLNIEKLFLAGLVCFLLTHLLYIQIFSKKAKLGITTVLAFVSVVATFYSFAIHPYVPNALIIPIIVYMLIITAMGITLNSLIKSDHKQTTWIGIAAILFILSDSLIAVNKFVLALPYPTLLIMATYGVAQYLITLGYIDLFSEKNRHNSGGKHSQN